MSAVVDENRDFLGKNCDINCLFWRGLNFRSCSSNAVGISCVRRGTLDPKFHRRISMSWHRIVCIEGRRSSIAPRIIGIGVIVEVIDWALLERAGSFLSTGPSFHFQSRNTRDGDWTAPLPGHLYKIRGLGKWTKESASRCMWTQHIRCKPRRWLDSVKVVQRRDTASSQSRIRP